jgi:prolyl-tRNA editing enzyme YbaK/EbsC (Cys-tRNA(Pro) deacylase)
VELHWEPATSAPSLLGSPVRAALEALSWADEVRVAAINPALADTATFSDAYGVALEQSANCVVVAGRRGERTTYAACVVLATTRADVNGLVRRRLDARKASFAPQDDAVAATGMAFGGITPIGLPPDWPVLVDAAVPDAGEVIVGSGIRSSKLLLPGARLAQLSAAEVFTGLGRPAPG